MHACKCTHIRVCIRALHAATHTRVCRVSQCISSDLKQHLNAHEMAAIQQDDIHRSILLCFFLKFHLNEFIRDAIDGSATSVQIMMTIDSVIKVQ